MNIETFWEIVGAAKQASKSYENRAEALKKELMRLSAEEVQAFDRHYFDQIIRSYRWGLWGAKYVINGGCSDEGFRYFCDFLISEGREVFEAALDDPESLSFFGDIDDAELEEFGYVAMEVYEEKTGVELPAGDKELPGQLMGEEWDEDSVDTRYPILSAQYGNAS